MPPDDISDRPDLMRYLPHFLDGRIITTIMNIIAEEMETTMRYISDMNMQILSVDTATHKLSEYERELGLQPNISQSYEDRRKIIKTKLRGSGTVTKDMIMNAAGSFSDGKIDIIEYPEEYYFAIKFTGLSGDIRALVDILDIIKPAHLSYNLTSRYDTDLQLQTRQATYSVPYNMCGTFFCGTKPYIQNEGISFSTGLNMGTGKNVSSKQYPMSGTFKAGGDKV